MSDIGNTPEEHMPRPPEKQQMDLPPQFKYGVSVFEMTNGEPVMHVHAGPDVADVSVGELWRMVAQVALNLELEMQSAKFMQAFDQMREAKAVANRIIKP